MIPKTEAASNTLRNAGKRTIALQIFSALLLVALAYLYVDMSKRQGELQDSIRENAIWSAYQLDREANALDHIYDMVRTEGLYTQNLKTLSKRYDILYSRVDILSKAKFSAHFAADRTIHKQLSEIRGLVFGLAPFFDSINAGKRISRSDYESISHDIEKIGGLSDEFLLTTNNSVSVERAESRERILALQQTSAVILTLLLISVLVLIWTLQRQLRAFRQAGLDLEDVAKELVGAYNAADAGNRAKSQFMATMGHEIRTPLNAILGLAELMESSSLSKADAENIRIIRSSGEALLEIINEILDFAKIEHGSLELEERNIDIRNMLDKTVAIIAGRASAKNIGLVFEPPQSLSVPIIRTDPTRLRQVLLNLLSNAVKFTDKGQVTLRVSEHTDRGDLHLRVEVQDTGIGIDQAGRDRLFKPFSQVDATISRKYGGTGLGLTICKQIIEQMGGRIGVDSVMGLGSTFWFDIPVAPATLDDEPGHVVAAASETVIPPLRILLVEDNQVNQKVAIRFLAKLGQTADIANHGGEAVAMTEANVYDVILMDMQMPVMDGIEATRRIKERGGASAETPIVAMTANASEEDRETCMKTGMAGFETKPVTLVRLRAVLETACQARGIALLAVATEAQVELQGDRPAEASPVVVDMPAESNVVAFPSAQTADEPVAIDAARRDELVEALGEEIYDELLQSFFDDAASLLVELRTALGSADDAAKDAALHTIKGAAANVGLAGISERANAMRKEPITETDVERLAAKIEHAKTELAA